MRHKPRTSPIHHAEFREDFLAELRKGATRKAAAESIGCGEHRYRTVSRYLADHPEFEREVIAAEAGDEIAPSPAQAPAPVAVARFVHEAEPVDAAPCDAKAPRDPMRLAPTRELFEERLAEVINDPDNKHWGKAADICARYFYGPEMLKALRLAEREAGAKPGDNDGPRVVFVIVQKAEA
jgi:hypothetical protein